MNSQKVNRLFLLYSNLLEERIHPLTSRHVPTEKVRAVLSDFLGYIPTGNRSDLVKIVSNEVTKILRSGSLN